MMGFYPKLALDIFICCMLMTGLTGPFANAEQFATAPEVLARKLSLRQETSDRIYQEISIFESDGRWEMEVT